MAGVELPIDPSVDGHQRLRALVPLFPNNPDSAVPVALPTLDGNWDLDMEARSGRVESFARLGVAEIFTGQTSINRVTTVWDALVGKKAVAGAGASPPIIYETFWGVGLRITLTFTSTDISSAVNVAAVAASSELHALDIQYEIKAIGLGPEELAMLLAIIPPLGRFDLNAYTLLTDARTTVTKALLGRLKNLDEARATLQPVIIKLSQTPFDDELLEASEYRFTMQSLAAGLSRQETLARLTKSGWNARADRVKAIHQKFSTQDKPTAAEQAAAQKWLSTNS